MSMKLTHFFKGNLRREESTSAFLAMALEGVPKFRRHFFEKILPNEAASLSERIWDVSVEKDWVDVRMNTDGLIVIIENKVNSGAKRQEQLLEYYNKARQADDSSKIIAVYLAPGQTGLDEVVRVRDSAQFRSNDSAEHLSWEKLIAYSSDPADIRDDLVQSGLNSVKEIIEEARRGIYIAEGDRGTIRDMVNHARDLVAQELAKKGVTLSLQRWSGKDFEQILTVRTNISLWLDAVFEVEEEPPFSPLNLHNQAGGMEIWVRSQFRLAEKIRKTNPLLAHWWTQNMGSEGYNVSGVGWHTQDEKGWFIYKREIHGTEESISESLAGTAVAIIDGLSNLLFRGGFKLVEDRLVN